MHEHGAACVVLRRTARLVCSFQHAEATVTISQLSGPVACIHNLSSPYVQARWWDTPPPHFSSPHIHTCTGAGL